MNKLTRRLGTLLLTGVAAMMLVGCGSSAKGGSDEGEKIGQLALPLVTQGASGVTYRLRDATFAIHNYNYYYTSPASGGSGSGSAGSGMGGGGEVITVSSEDDPDAVNISLSLEEGQYYIELLDGWHFEKELPGGGSEAVTATLLSGQTQWVWVSRQSTSFAEYQFGLGDRELWLNGQLNIGVVLYEDPSEVGTGGTGFGGSPGTGGGFNMGAGGSSPVPAGGSWANL
jgi:hypothetical protein